MILCTKCDILKDESEFTFNTRTQKFNGWCKQCYREHNNSKYADLNSGRKEKLDKQKEFRRTENRIFVFQFLSKSKCAVCSESDPIVLEFHHLRDKKYLISNMVSSCCSISAIEEEISKCEVLCANCHRRKTAKDQNWYSKMENINSKEELFSSVWKAS